MTEALPANAPGPPGFTEVPPTLSVEGPGVDEADDHSASVKEMFNEYSRGLGREKMLVVKDKRRVLKRRTEEVRNEFYRRARGDEFERLYEKVKQAKYNVVADVGRLSSEASAACDELIHLQDVIRERKNQVLAGFYEWYSARLRLEGLAATWDDVNGALQDMSLDAASSASGFSSAVPPARPVAIPSLPSLPILSASPPTSRPRHPDAASVTHHSSVVATRDPEASVVDRLATGRPLQEQGRNSMPAAELAQLLDKSEEALKIRRDELRRAHSRLEGSFAVPEQYMQYYMEKYFPPGGEDAQRAKIGRLDREVLELEAVVADCRKRLWRASGHGRQKTKDNDFPDRPAQKPLQRALPGRIKLVPRLPPGMPRPREWIPHVSPRRDMERLLQAFDREEDRKHAPPPPPPKHPEYGVDPRFWPAGMFGKATAPPPDAPNRPPSTLSPVTPHTTTVTTGGLSQGPRRTHFTDILRESPPESPEGSPPGSPRDPAASPTVHMNAPVLAPINPITPPRVHMAPTFGTMSPAPLSAASPLRGSAASPARTGLLPPLAEVALSTRSPSVNDILPGDYVSPLLRAPGKRHSGPRSVSSEPTQPTKSILKKSTPSVTSEPPRTRPSLVPDISRRSDTRSLSPAGPSETAKGGFLPILYDLNTGRVSYENGPAIREATWQRDRDRPR